MAVGLILGVDAEPTQEQFQELLDTGVVEPEGFTFEALAVSADEASNRDELRELYKAACAKAGWHDGIALVDDLRFADLVVRGGRLVVVTPPSAPPEALTGGVLAGIGFTPDQADVQSFGQHVRLHPDRQYVLTSFTESEARHDDKLMATYLGNARRQGWSGSATDCVSVARHTVAGKHYVVIEPGAVGTRAAAPGPSDPTEKGGWLRRLTRRSGAG